MPAERIAVRLVHEILRWIMTEKLSVHLQLGGDGANLPLLNVVIAQDLRLGLRGNGHAQVLLGQSFETCGGGARSLGGRNPGSGSRTNGSAAARLAENRRWRTVLSPPPGLGTSKSSGGAGGEP